MWMYFLLGGLALHSVLAVGTLVKYKVGGVYGLAGWAALTGVAGFGFKIA